jgi:hypothetical protein
MNVVNRVYPTVEQLMPLAQDSTPGPIAMANLLKFRDKAQYRDGRPDDISGREAFMRYLAENHNIPLRRIVLPFGYGEAMPVADNATRDGRKQNRRVEVSILVSKGLTNPVNVNRSVGSNSQP